MNVKNGYFYFVKDLFFDKVKNDERLLKNKDNGNKRPCYYCFKDNTDNEIMWFVPISHKVQKYEDIVEHKIKKQLSDHKKPRVDNIVFGKVMGEKKVFLIQNMFPVTSKYIVSVYKNKNGMVTINPELQNEIRRKANRIMELVDKGYKGLVFPDIKGIKDIMKDELTKQLKIDDIFRSKSKTFLEDFKIIVQDAISVEDLYLYISNIDDSYIWENFSEILSTNKELDEIKKDFIYKMDSIIDKYILVHKELTSLQYIVSVNDLYHIYDNLIDKKNFSDIAHQLDKPEAISKIKTMTTDELNNLTVKSNKFQNETKHNIEEKFDDYDDYSDKI